MHLSWFLTILGNNIDTKEMEMLDFPPPPCMEGLRFLDSHFHLPAFVDAQLDM